MRGERSLPSYPDRGPRQPQPWGSQMENPALECKTNMIHQLADMSCTEGMCGYWCRQYCQSARISRLTSLACAGPLRRRLARSAMYKLRGLCNRMQDSSLQEEENEYLESER